MSDKHPDNFIQQMRDLKLSSATRERMRGELSAYADFHPMHAGAAAATSSFITIFTSTRLRMASTAFVVALIFVGAGTSFAAQQALPGEPLYAVKLHVNEELRSALAFGVANEARLQAELLDERFAEIETLAARGELDAATAAEAEARIATHAEASMQLAAEAEADGDGATALNVREQVFASLDAFQARAARSGIALGGRLATVGREQAAEQSSTLRTVADDADTTARIAAKESIEATGGAQMMTMMSAPAEEISAAAMLPNAHARIAGLEAALEGTTELDGEVRAELEAALDDAEAALTAAEAKLEAEGEAAAAQAINEAIGAVADLEARLSTYGSVTIDEDTGAIIKINIDTQGDWTEEQSSIEQTEGGTSVNVRARAVSEGGSASVQVQSSVNSSSN